MNLNTKALMRLVFFSPNALAIVHVVKDTFLSASEVIELHNLAVG